MINYPRTTNFQGAIYVGNWGTSNIPIYNVPNMHALNQLVGYIKHIIVFYWKDKLVRINIPN